MAPQMGCSLETPDLGTFTEQKVHICKLQTCRDVGKELTVDSRHNDGPHQLRVSGAFPVQSDAAGPDLPGSAVDGVEGVCRTDAVHHCPVFPIIWIHCQHL